MHAGHSPWPGRTAARLWLTALIEVSVTSWLLGKSWTSRPGGQRDPPVWSPLRNASALCPPTAQCGGGNGGGGATSQGDPGGGNADNRPLPHVAHCGLPFRGRAGGGGPLVQRAVCPPAPCLPALPSLGAALDWLLQTPWWWGGSSVPSPPPRACRALPSGCDPARVWGRDGGSCPPSLPRAARPCDSEHVSVTCPSRNLRPRPFSSLTGAPCVPGLPSQQLACSPTLWPGPGLSLLCAACGPLAAPRPRPWT